MLDFLNQHGIRSAVISNLLWSGAALTERLNRLLPNNQFEFVMTSSDYFMRKPNRILLILLSGKPVLLPVRSGIAATIRRRTLKPRRRLVFSPFGTIMTQRRDYKDRSKERIPQCEHLHIHAWNEMINLLEKLKHESSV